MKRTLLALGLLSLIASQAGAVVAVAAHPAVVAAHPAPVAAHPVTVAPKATVVAPAAVHVTEPVVVAPAKAPATGGTGGGGVKPPAGGNGSQGGSNDGGKNNKASVNPNIVQPYTKPGHVPVIVHPNSVQSAASAASAPAKKRQ